MGISVESNLADGILERWLADEDALTRFVSGFLECRIALTDWTHRAHVGVAAALVLEQGEGTALEMLRVAIPRFNVASGGANTEVSGYHESLTVFWVQRVSRLLRRLPAGLGRLEKVRVVVEALGEFRRLDKLFYSFDVVKSKEARMQWVPPDVM